MSANQSVQTIPLKLFADFFQLYLQDDEIGVVDLSDAWTEEAVNQMLATAPRAVGIGTGRNVTVDVTLIVASQERQLDASQWDNIVEADVEIKSGRIVVAGCTDYFPDALRVEVAPGNYRVRACAGNLTSVHANQMDGEDFYEISLWPSEPLGVRAVKQFGLH